jgi:hypothetical protein
LVAAKRQRDHLCDYVNGTGAVPWQAKFAWGKYMNLDFLSERNKTKETSFKFLLSYLLHGL